MKIAICDDTEDCLTELKEFIGLYDIERGFNEKIEVATFQGSEGLFISVQGGEEYDLIFMDIELGDENGIDVAARVSKECPNALVVFISYHSNYYEDAADADSIGFILKPFTKEKVFLRLERTVEKIAISKKTYYTFKFKGRNRDVNLNDVVEISSLYRIITIRMKDEQEYSFYGTLSEVLRDVATLYPYFVQVNKSLIVNVQHISEYTDEVFILDDDIPITIRPKYRPNFRNMMDFKNIMKRH